MKKISPSDYIYAIARIRALENFLIKREVFEETIESGTQEALKVFAESDIYSDELIHVKNSSELENILDKEVQSLKEFIRSLLLDEGLLGLLETESLACVEGVLKTYRSPTISNYLKQVIDMHNIKTFLRLYIFKEPPERLEKELTCQGFIKRKDFLWLYSQELPVFLNRLEYVHVENQTLDYAYFLSEAIEKVSQQKSFVALEKAIKDFLIEILRPVKYITFGPEPVLAYYFARLNEIDLIRMIIIGKLNAVPKELLRERLNAVYA